MCLKSILDTIAGLLIIYRELKIQLNCFNATEEKLYCIFVYAIVDVQTGEQQNLAAAFK